MNYDLLIKGGTVVDGKGNPAFSGAVAVKAGKIEKVIRNKSDQSAAEKQSREIIDATGLTVCPGFIDMHSHTDWIMPLEEHPTILAPLIEQGITTVIGGNCGYSAAPLKTESSYIDLVQAESDFIAERPLDFKWAGIGSYMDILEKQGVALNMAMLAGHGNLRLSMFGPDFSYPGDVDLKLLVADAAEALEDGACGISLGLGYAPGLFSEMRELEKFAETARDYNRILTVHLKAYTLLSGAYPLKLFGAKPHNLQALQEMIELARRTGVKMQISHLLLVGKKTWPLADSILGMIEEAVAEGLDIAFDSFPYTCGNTTIYIAYPTWFRENIEKNFKNPAARMRLKLEIAFITKQLGFSLADIQVLWGGHPEVEPYAGLFFDQIARQMGLSLFEAYLKVSEMSGGKTLCLLHKYNGDADDESVLHRVLTHPLNLVETDTILTSRGLQNPSSFGAFPRYIQRYHRDLGLLTLEEAIAKMTGKSAERFGLAGRGSVTEGSWADLVIFDHDNIRDNTTVHDLEKSPTGIKHVLINGTEVVRGGKAMPDRLAGRVLRVS